MNKINNKIFKKVLSKFSTGVTVVGISINGENIGKTVNSFSTLSLSPPLVLFSLDKKASSLNKFKKCKFLSINILSNKQIIISKNFAKKSAKWKNISFKYGKLKTPVIDKCIGNLECSKIKSITEGDHVIFICKVINAAFNDNIKPLIYYNSKYNFK